MSDTQVQYQNVIEMCRDIFTKKMEDYGTAWRIMRPQSLTDQIYIKVKRIIKEIDPSAFVITTGAAEVLGEGFQKLT